jgi:exportin-1
VLTM